MAQAVTLDLLVAASVAFQCCAAAKTRVGQVVVLQASNLPVFVPKELWSTTHTSGACCLSTCMPVELLSRRRSSVSWLLLQPTATSTVCRGS